METLIRRMSLVSLLTVVAWAYTSQAADEQVRDVFENRYQAWKAWVNQHPLMSTYTTCQEFQEIVALGVPIMPFLVEKMEKNRDDFHLECAIYRITKKDFEKSAWPKGKIGDSITAAKMYSHWWREERFKTGDRFAELHGKWKTLKAEKKDKEAQEIYVQISNLGLPVLPYLVEKVDSEPELFAAFSKLAGNELPATVTRKECRQWWKENRQKLELPPSANTLP